MDLLFIRVKVSFSRHGFRLGWLPGTALYSHSTASRDCFCVLGTPVAAGDVSEADIAQLLWGFLSV